MRCEACGGTGRVRIEPTPMRVAQGTVGVATWIVCDECRGACHVSCCEGTERHAGVAGQPGSETGMECAR